MNGFGCKRRAVRFLSETTQRRNSLKVSRISMRLISNRHTLADLVASQTGRGAMAEALNSHMRKTFLAAGTSGFSENLHSSLLAASRREMFATETKFA